MIARLLLPSRAGTTDHCAECDGPRDGAGPLCSDCADTPVHVRIEERYQDGHGITPMGTVGRWELAREFHPLHWGLGLDITWLFTERMVSLQLGPFAFYARWEAPGVR